VQAVPLQLQVRRAGTPFWERTSTLIINATGALPIKHYVLKNYVGNLEVPPPGKPSPRAAVKVAWIQRPRRCGSFSVALELKRREMLGMRFLPTTGWVSDESKMLSNPASATDLPPASECPSWRSASADREAEPAVARRIIFGCSCPGKRDGCFPATGRQLARLLRSKSN